MFYKSGDESFVSYRNRVINSVSPSFCAAKWYNATIWLGTGMTASCHHPIPHQIPVEELSGNPTAIHNTSHKKAMRKLMLEGKRPAECEYCWKVENMGPEHVSDRVFKTLVYKEEEIKEITTMPWEANVNLKTLEISFDRACNLACSYCNSCFSTTWGKDISKDGVYKNLVSDGASTYMSDGAYNDVYKNRDDNPYIKAFWTWWDSDLSKSLIELRVTGGEPLLSTETWKLIDRFESQQLDMMLAINSNLMAKQELIDRLVSKLKNVKNCKIFTSCEATYEQAEYIRDGLKYTYWKNNLKRLISETEMKNIVIMMTINSLCLFSVTDFFDEMYELKELLHTLSAGMERERTLLLSLNILRFPSFQSVAALPNHIKEHCREKLKTWYESNKDKPLWLDAEHASIQRLLEYLAVVEEPHRMTSDKMALWRDFKTFYKQYDQRRNKSLNVFPTILTDWVKDLPDTDFTTLTNKEIDELAVKEGWIPGLKNPFETPPDGAM